MKHEYISLGGGCDTAMILDYYGLRTKSLPFDWLWNLDEGLSAVIEIIKNQYQEVTQDRLKCYQLSEHCKFLVKMITYSGFPSIVHLHSNPMENESEHEKLVKRFRRLDNILKSNSVKHFIYYRAYEEGKSKNKEITIQDSLARLIGEGNNFYNSISEIYPNIQGKFSLLLVLQTLHSDELLALSEIEKAKKDLKNLNIQIGYTISRSDHDLEYRDIWLKQWKRILCTKTRMPWFIFFRVELRFFFLTAKHRALKLIKMVNSMFFNN